MTNRPKENDESVIDAAARRALVRFERTFGYSCELEMLKRSLRNIWEDGYVRAKDWESHGWKITFPIVEFLNDLDAKREHKEAVSAWAFRERVKCPYAIGAMVNFPILRGFQVGEIVAIDETYATVTVFCAARGDVREGLGTYGTIVAFEELREASVHA
jgi:hypothetical protein